MELTQLLNSVHAIQVTGDVQRKDVSGIYYDSRRVKTNSIFVAIKGFNSDGHKFISEAINNGAIAIVIEDNNSIPENYFHLKKIARILVASSRIALAELSNAFYKEAASHLFSYAVTGTNGKTTTTYLLKNILEKSGKKTGLIGTIANIIGDKIVESQMTTPESSDLHELFFLMVSEQCSSVVMEISSHSLTLERVYGIPFNVAIFSNITSDHLDFHNTFENYLNAKKKLFVDLPENSFAVVNCDDDHYLDLVKDCKAKIITYGKTENADFRISNISFNLSGTHFSLLNYGKEYKVETPLIGEFNAYNAASAFAAAFVGGISIDQILNGIKTVPLVSGRFEIVSGKTKKAVIDYSHTADSLEKAIINLRKVMSVEIKLITVFGCGGNRDATKRPQMGRIATELSDSVIITNDNPRNENAETIIADIEKGITKNNYEIILDREEAIKKAITESDDSSVVLVAGKGHENYQIIQDVKHHFSDKEIAEKYLTGI
ncbi:MAG: UDP-N-acetylmuramoyl-L-alanyl-D-glutamate--2,6-diaminopimelate ligase [Ignavibacteriaceae bacterium]|jgi:UDP-N-acetylmuramoyl-L-alanyl-D-glutamate--2,6-diaminopimelate ligase|nr:UDP-N-acetylmuramoyl-L-alanyl-D-glutamate--2,6-diaminopimelate ligase [Ignavibacteriaceae bacterium]